MLDSNKGTVVLLNPTAPPRDIEHPMAERLPDMGGKTIGFLCAIRQTRSVVEAKIRN